MCKTTAWAQSKKNIAYTQANGNAWAQSKKIITHTQEKRECVGTEKEKHHSYPRGKGMRGHREGKTSSIPNQKESNQKVTNQPPKQKESNQNDSKQKDSNQQAPPIYYFCRFFEYFLVNFEKKLDI